MLMQIVRHAVHPSTWRAWCVALAALTCGALAMLPAAAQAEGLPALVARVKPSIVLVGTLSATDAPRFQFRGTGFAVGDGRLIITSAHVLPDSLAAPAGGVRSPAIQVLRNGQWSPQPVRVKVSNAMYDLAVLEVDGAPLSPLALEEGAAAVAEGADIALVGFPLGIALGYSHVSHRGVLAAITDVAPLAQTGGSLTARAAQQLRAGNFSILQLDVTAFPGNSGGPVFDLESGRVIGVLAMGLIKGTKESAISVPTGISFAVPVARVLELLKRGD
ncbi:S1 family peptidase [Roseateles paludis]|jgi:S1-C subfamily serine protease|uniref:Serine protease n=1 Tax=Roseateles paludis TaxID=3145238 RepID=A0ABV0G063_9BURK